MDLFIDDKLAAVNLGFEARGQNLDVIEFFGSTVGDTLVDNLRVDPANMLFPDADKDGLPDAWEIANGSNPNLYDRDAIDPATGKSFLDKYLDSLWNAQNPGDPIDGNVGGGSIGNIPPLTILNSHQPVGAVKGSLTVGGDGSATYSVPIDIPKGTAGMEPKISLDYSSSGGNGIAGLGWSLNGLQQIVRGGSSFYKDPITSNDPNDTVNGAVDGVDFDYKDRFFLGGERLICVGGAYYGAPGSVYRTENDSYSRITAIGGATSPAPWLAGSVPGPTSWRVETKSGLTVYLGETAESKVTRTEGVLSWGVTKVEDSVGNFYSVDYSRTIASGSDPFPGEIRNQRVSAIHYTGHANHDPYATIEFEYQTRPDTRIFFTSGVRQYFDQRLETIRIKTGQYENHRYELSYATSHQTGRSLLEEIAKVAAGQVIPPTRFEWQTLEHGEEKWVASTDPLKVAEYGSNFDSRDGVTGMISPVSGDPTQVHLTGAAWRAIPLSPDYPITPNTILDFEYRAGPMPTFAMIGLDENLLSTSPGRLVKLVGGSSPPGGVVANSLYQNGATGQFQRMQVPIGQSYTCNAAYLVLVNDDVHISSGVGESWFRNIRIYENGTLPANLPPPIDFTVYGDLENMVPQMVNNQGSDLAAC